MPLEVWTGGEAKKQRIRWKPGSHPPHKGGHTWACPDLLRLILLFSILQTSCRIHHLIYHYYSLQSLCKITQKQTNFIKKYKLLIKVNFVLRIVLIMNIRHTAHKWWPDHRGPVVSMSDCGERTQVWISLRMVLFIVMATVIWSLGHGLCTYCSA